MILLPALYFILALMCCCCVYYFLQAKKYKQQAWNIKDELQQLIDTANTFIFSVDMQANIREWSNAAEQISGYKKASLAGHSCLEIFTGDDNARTLKKTFKNTQEGQVLNNIELSFDSIKGDCVDLLLNTSPSRDANGVIIGMIAVGQDITALNISKAQTIQASKLATLGEMTTSVAHELNQPLNVMRMALGNCRRKLENGNNNLDYYLSKVERLDSQVDRMAGIVNHMRMFGRKASESFTPLNLRDIVDSSFQLMTEQLRLAGIEIKKDFGDSFPFVMGHQIQLEQVLLNLIANARDAMNSKIMAEQKILHVNIACENDHASILIEDNGGGLTDDQIDRIFEPFFTTKEAGKGTGLGLSVSYGIIKDMGGSLSVENIKNENTTIGAKFIISLPIVRHRNK
ncbi:MAG: ATP-binding protein [Mariprofundaceae bacterium]|nr:ATP-binding protein [Mariprofundaceae bacterium]